MAASIVTFILGIICICLGISNMRGNLSSLHSYHRNRVSEEDRLSMGKKVGLGTVTVGGAIIAFSALSAVTFFTENQAYILIGTAVLLVGLAVGLVISLYAIHKYNKGIF